MDFFEIVRKRVRDKDVIYPDFRVIESSDLMVRGGEFYAVWDEPNGLWSKNDKLVVAQIDKAIHDAAQRHPEVTPQYLRTFETGHWEKFIRFMRSMGTNAKPLNTKVVFANEETKKEDYASFKLDYSLSDKECPAWDELVEVLYSDSERDKIEWAIGSILSGDSKRLQKFLVFYGQSRSGKSTILHIVEKLLKGYSVTFDAKQLGSTNGTFSTGPFANNPLVAIQHDGDLSRIEDNGRLNSIVAHEPISINSKYKQEFVLSPVTFLMMGTNQPVRITDSKSGIPRRLIDVRPTGNIIEFNHYIKLLKRIDHELGSIANKCLRKYNSMGFNYYDDYTPIEMMLNTNAFFNFIEYYFDLFKAEDGVTLQQAWDYYKQFCAESNIKNPLPRFKFREELSSFFDEFHDRIKIDGVDYRSYYKGFHYIPTASVKFATDKTYTIELNDAESSIFDDMYKDQPAQYANEKDEPRRSWDNVKSKLSSLDPTKVHYVKVPEQHIVIDFDLKDANGDKNLELNIQEASSWPPTYSEVSKSGKGLHLHYIYDDDVHELASIFSEGIEIKTLLGNSALRRKLTQCNNHLISELSGSLPKKERKMLDTQSIKSEMSLRYLIERNLRKEIHSATKPSVDFILKILEDAYSSDLKYDVSDMRSDILGFAAKSTNNSAECISLVMRMPFRSKVEMEEAVADGDDSSIIFFDVEVYPNLFVVCWKTNREGSPVVKMLNPGPKEIGDLLNKKLVGFYNRRYDNHILYARYLGWSLDRLFHLSQDIVVKNVESSMFGEAFNLSYTDVWDFCSKKQSLKKWEIELGVKHMQIDIPWDEPVEDERKITKILDYCANDVLATEAVFHARQPDFVARKILAALSGLSVNHTTQQHTAKIIFGDDKNPQRKFVYTNLATEFPGYKHDGKVSTYRGETTGEGGYVYSEPGIYEGVALLDVASMHPASIELLNLFGPYTSRFSDLKAARLAIKHKQYEVARHLLEGRLQPFLVNAESNPTDSEALSYALKIVINIVYGLTSASFDNAFKDRRNKDNIVAKRGALFMIDLKHAVQEQGFIVAHIKTDSIKIPYATPEIIQFVIDFGHKYGYDFEHELTYDKFCLVNDAVYVAREGGKWTAVGAQFQHPYVFKKLFSNEEITFDDICETKSVLQGSMYLDPNDAENVSDMVFVGTVGRFVPVENNGGNLWRIKDGKKFHVTGTKGFRWIRADLAADRDSRNELHVDMSYFEKLRTKAIGAIDNVGSFEDLVNN